jgi:hypothetical protein
MNGEGRKWEEAGDNCVIRGFVIGALHQTLLEQSNEGR